jgi:hypothetical protein
MRKLLLSFVGAIILLFPALALGSEEQIIDQTVTVPYFDIWKHTDGTWQDTSNDGKPDAKGQKDKTTKLNYTLDNSLLQKYTVTKVEVTPNIDENTYNTAGKWNGKNWEYFKTNYYKYRAVPLKTSISNKDLTKGTATVQFIFDLAPQNNAIDRKAIRFDGDNNAAIDAAAEGWRWYLPALITWHGIPKEQPADLPDAYVKAIIADDKETEAGKTYKAKVTYGLKAQYKGNTPCKLGLTHNTYGIAPIDGQKLELSPGEEKTFEFTFTGQEGKNSVLEAKIWPETGDKDWSNNSKELIVPCKQGEADLSAKIMYDRNIVDSGSSVNIYGVAKNHSDHEITTKVVFRVNGGLKKAATITIPAQKFIKTTYKLSVPAKTPTGQKYYAEFEVNPDRNQPSNEKSWENNIDSDTLESYLDDSKTGRLRGGFTK